MRTLATSLAARAAIPALTLAFAAGAAQAQSTASPNEEAAAAFSGAEILSLAQLDFEPAAFGLWSGLDMLEADLLDPEGEDIGDIEDILVTVDGYAVALVVELDEFLEFDETMLSIPLSVLELLPEAEAVDVQMALVDAVGMDPQLPHSCSEGLNLNSSGAPV